VEGVCGPAKSSRCSTKPNQNTILRQIAVPHTSDDSDDNYRNGYEHPILDVRAGLKKSEQGDKWSFCLTAGTLCPANQERQ
jgi:hypothetical protein